MPSLTSLKGLKLSELTYCALKQLGIENIEYLLITVSETTEKEIIKKRYMSENRWMEIKKH